MAIDYEEVAKKEHLTELEVEVRRQRTVRPVRHLVTPRCYHLRNLLLSPL
jgi:hypothetical protein